MRPKTSLLATPVRAFVSYSTKDKLVGAAAKEVLTKFGIEAFLAHDDLRVSERWEKRILEELAACDIFVPLLSKSFKKSPWAEQEVGYIVSRKDDVAIAPLSIDGTTPHGFIGHIQSRNVPQAGISRELLIEPLLLELPRKIIPGYISLVEGANTYRGAEAVMKPLVPYFKLFTKEEARAFADASVANDQVWSASLCKTEYLPDFLKKRADIGGTRRKALQYQIRHDKRFAGA